MTPGLRFRDSFQKNFFRISHNVKAGNFVALNINRKNGVDLARFLVQEHRSGAAVNLDKSHFDVMLDPGNNRHPEFKHGNIAEDPHSGRSYLSTAIGEEGDVLC